MTPGDDGTTPRPRLRRPGGWPPSPGGPFRKGFWRSPVRGPWLTSVLGLILLVGLSVIIVTGLLSYAAYNPDLMGNDQTPNKGILGFYLFDWPTHPYWLYRVTQGLHVTLGLVLVPVVLAKLWSVIPKLFDWPPVKTPAQAIERVSLLLLVGSVVFEFVTGIMNVQYWYVFPGSFYRLHLYGAWVFIAAFLVHVAFRLGKMRTTLRARRFRDELRIDTAHTVPEPPDPDHLVSDNPAPATISRRGVLGLVGASSLTILALTVGQSIGGPLRRTALLAPRGQDPGSGPNGFQINKTAEAVGVRRAQTGSGWRLTIIGQKRARFSRDELLAMPQHTAQLPIACVEGWSTDNQEWTGVRLRDLAELAGLSAPDSVYVESLQQTDGFGKVSLRGNQIADGDSLLALQANGVDLSLDHGYPARVIVPNNPGVNNTKWVTRMTFQA